MAWRVVEERTWARDAVAVLQSMVTCQLADYMEYFSTVPGSSTRALTTGCGIHTRAAAGGSNRSGWLDVLLSISFTPGFEVHTSPCTALVGLAVCRASVAPGSHGRLGLRRALHLMHGCRALRVLKFTLHPGFEVRTPCLQKIIKDGVARPFCSISPC